MNKAVFLDRDDTLIKNIPYLGDPNLVQLLPHVKEALSLLKDAGFRLFIITNQSGVGRGLLTKEQVRAVNERVLQLLGKDLIDDIYCCFDDPNDPAEGCRKPSPKLIFHARNEHNINLSSSYFIGDRLADIQAGKNAGCKTVLVLSGLHRHEISEARALADYVATDLWKAANWICIQGAI